MTSSTILISAGVIIMILGRPETHADETPSYDTARENLESARKKHATLYRNARTTDERQKILSNSAHLFSEGLTGALAPHWIGTRWAFHGTSVTPQHGNIACGYFVSTLLQHSGLPIDRVKVGQMPSQKIIRHLIGTKQKMPILVGVSLDTFLETVRSMGTGLYVVGLDYHVGFLHVRPAKHSRIHKEELEVRFLHSNFVRKQGVIDESAVSSVALSASKYRVVGKLTECEALIKRWLGVR